jgi:ABC-type nickel/cobalt efflux system permease component RcnA
MRRLALLAVIAAALSALVLPAAASAHPLGNFTINRYAGLELSGNRLYVTYVLDLAEIPTFQDSQEGIGAREYLARIERGLHVSVDAKPARLTVVAHRLAHPMGQGGLHTTRLEAILAGPTLRDAEAVRLDDRTYAGRIGWKEVVVTGSHGGAVSDSTAPATSQSDQLRAYPKDLLRSPLDVTSASARLEPGLNAGPAPTLSSQRSLQAPDRVADSGFTRLISRGSLSAGIIALSLLIAAFWGAVHALTPGHGKSLVAGYLIGTRGRPRDAVLLGATVTVTHTAGVFGLGLVTLLLSHYIVPDALYPWLTLVSGVLVVGVGLSVFRSRLRKGRWQGDDHHHDRPHAHPHRHREHEHEHGHEPLTSRGILGVGVAAGILPCPSALVVLLSAIALHRVGFGIVLILAFSLGLAATVTGIGLMAVLARRFFNRVSLEGRMVRLLPAVSALVILCVGVGITARALPRVV